MKLEFFTNMMEENLIPDIFGAVHYLGHRYENPEHQNSRRQFNYYSFRLVPGYMELDMVPSDSNFKKVIPQINWGYAINLSDISSIDTYLEKQFKSKYRSIIRRYVNRLEHCFDISYQLYYGEIDPEVYHSIMDSLRGMITERFGQRQEIHKDLKRWDILVEETFKKISKKRASLFVIYDRKHPIQISLNYHFDKILFSAISSYDVSYSKFGLGHVEIYKQLQWCISNNLCLYEMGVGGMDYKRRWSNTIYQYQHYVVYPKKRFVAKLLASAEIKRVALKEYLKSKKVNELVARTKAVLMPKQDSKTVAMPSYQFSNIALHRAPTDSQLIDVSLKENGFLKKYLYDFLYLNVEHVSDVSIFASAENEGYIFTGKSCSQLLAPTK
ncbi:MAG: GNAT family N-acetyltransferase [Allomuricauda sp.]|nr:MAG: GNAT family N-acetyltransferase [Allomuricauda sp.]